ncbi:DUF1631 domain-containing protein [Aquincola sp. J276]|uniref:DUF1631 domain-containing protein n=1 Tax=Aquincola sp. J276 TaxID=2898432 RepID=UPI0021514B53|nr:DUF1631 domain-containing protein [Aquincola sp. J276]MCR5865525.1 DUF1631 domain-containing protein [Aquincola sp. J276]
MPRRPSLPQFIDDELARAPLLMQEVLNGVAALSAGSGPGQALLPDVQRLVHLYRAELVSGFARRLGELLRPQAPGGRLPHGLGTLSLVEDAAVQTDVELSRSVQALAAATEFELRELRAFTSALVGDLHVARDTNPLRPELFVRSLWSAVGELPASPGLQLAFLRTATPPLARALRMAYASACTRLEDAGVTPSSYRTIVTGTQSRSWHRQNPPPPTLEGLRKQMPAAAAPTVAESAAVLPNAADAPLLLPRIFDAILQGSGLAADVQALLQRVQPVALRVARQDPTTLDAYTHPMWEFIDRIAFLAKLHEPPADAQRQQLLAQAGTLVAAMACEEQPDAASFRWALKRLATQAQQQFHDRLQAAADAIATLETLGPSFPPTAAERGVPLPLDAHMLSTVSADLLADAQATAAALPPEDADEAAAWLDGQQPAAWARIFIDGHWRVLQLLWQADDLWLFAELAGGRQTWALRRSALQRLHAEGLLRGMQPRSLVRRAAARLMRQIQEQGRRG